MQAFIRRHVRTKRSRSPQRLWNVWRWAGRLSGVLFVRVQSLSGPIKGRHLSTMTGCPSSLWQSVQVFTVLKDYQMYPIIASTFRKAVSAMAPGSGEPSHSAWPLSGKNKGAIAFRRSGLRRIAGSDSSAPLFLTDTRLLRPWTQQGRLGPKKRMASFPKRGPFLFRACYVTFRHKSEEEFQAFFRFRCLHSFPSRRDGPPTATSPRLLGQSRLG